MLQKLIIGIGFTPIPNYSVMISQKIQKITSYVMINLGTRCGNHAILNIPACLL